jgi:hypothetical protein
VLTKFLLCELVGKSKVSGLCSCYAPTMPHDHDDNDDDSSESRTEQFTKNRRLVGDGAESLETRARVAKGGPIDPVYKQIKHTPVCVWGHGQTWSPGVLAGGHSCSTSPSSIEHT